MGHWPDGTVLDVTAAASWSETPEGFLVAGDGPSAGLVLGADAGVSTVRARFGGATAQAPLVVEAQPGMLEAWPPGLTLAAGTELPLSVTLVSASGDSTDVTADAVWMSSAPEVALVTNAPTQQGRLLGVTAGTALLTARVGALQATVRVVVSAATLQGIDVHAPPATVTWAPAAFAATGHFSDGTTQDLTPWVSWTSSDPAVLRLRGTGPGRGSARGLTPGSVMVTARPRGGPPVSVVTGVNETALASLSVVAPSGPLAVGTRARVQALGRGADGTTVDVTPLVEWTSSDPTVATVSSVVRPGWLATLGDGSTTLQARLLGVGGTAELLVSTETLQSLSLAAPPTLQVGTGATAVATATLSGGKTQRLDEDLALVLGFPDDPRGVERPRRPGTAARARPWNGHAPGSHAPRGPAAPGHHGGDRLLTCAPDASPDVPPERRRQGVEFRPS